jgi:hypothetical protein
LISDFKIEDLHDRFNESEDSIRVITLVSPTCPECLIGVETIKRLFARFDSRKLRGFILWVRMLKEDDYKAARKRSEAFQDSRVMQMWDFDRNAAGMFGRALKLDVEAWDVYLLYSPRIRWENQERAPEPVFWMHQLSSADPKLRFDQTRFFEETKYLLEAEDPDLSDKEVTQILLDKDKIGSR